MPVIMTRTEESLDQLLRKLYGEIRPAELKRVRDAMLKANPHLPIEGNLELGTLVVLPDVRRRVREIPRSNNTVATDGIELIIAGIKAHVPLLTRQLEQAGQEIDQSAKLLKSTAFKKAIAGAQSEQAETLVKRVESALKVERETNKKTLSRFPEEVDALQENLSKLLKSLR